MSLDSWIDEHTLSMMRALAPSRGDETPGKEPEADFGFDPVPEGDDRLPETGDPARIAPTAEPDSATVQRLRSRLAEIRRRAEMGGALRTVPARITPSVPIAAPESGLSRDSEPPEQEIGPSDEVNYQPDAGSGVEAAESMLEGGSKKPPTPEAVISPFSVPAPAGQPQPVELPVSDSENTALPMPPTTESGAEEPPRQQTIIDSVRTTGLQIPEGPLAVRLDAYRRWLESDCGMAQSVVFDRHGCPLHPAEGQASFIAAAVSLGVAWREACALTDPPGTLRAVHSAWGTGTMAVIPVPTRFGDLFVAGQVGAAIEPERAAEIGSALRRTAGV